MKRTFEVAAAGLLLAAGLASPSSQAATITAVSPQGEVAQVRQVVVKFNEAVVPLGDLRQPDPATLSCQGGAAPGTARWINDRTWAFDLREPLPPGMRCLLKAKPEWKPLGGALTGTTEFRFGTGGPAVVQTQPYSGAMVEEDQAFILVLNGPVVEADVPKAAWCEVENLGEKLPVKLVTGAARDALLEARRLDKQADRVVVVGCGRPLANEAKLRVVWGKGIAARNDAKVVTSIEQRFDFQVRKAFTAEFSCERERANAPCLPIRPMTAALQRRRCRVRWPNRCGSSRPAARRWRRASTRTTSPRNCRTSASPARCPNARPSRSNCRGPEGRQRPAAGQRRQLSAEGGHRRCAADRQVRRRAVRHRRARSRGDAADHAAPRARRLAPAGAGRSGARSSA
jgi:hypothetical protein